MAPLTLLLEGLADRDFRDFANLYSSFQRFKPSIRGICKKIQLPLSNLNLSLIGTYLKSPSILLKESLEFTFYNLNL